MCEVSITVTTYGHEKYIRQALDSILMQEVDFAYEIIIGEDKSPDNTREILLEYQEKYPNRIQLILRDQNIGSTKNGYELKMRCRGRYIAALEGDDYWIDPKKLQKQKDFLDHNPEYSAVSHVIEGRINDAVIGKYPSARLRGKAISAENFLKGDTFGTNSLMYRNIFQNSNDKYDVIYKANRMVADLTTCMILLNEGKVYIMDEVMGVYRVRNKEGESNYNSIFSWKQKYLDSVQVISANNEYFNQRYNFFYFFFQFSAVAMMWSIKNRMFADFLEIFKIGPENYKIKYWLYMPIGLPKILLSKLYRVIKS